MKYNLKEITFLIPIRLDSIKRLENLIIVVEFLHKLFDTNIFILEASEYNNGIIESLLGKKIKYEFIEDRDIIFHRTKYINYMVNSTNSEYLAIWDSDVIINKKIIIDSFNKLKENEADMVYPYDGYFYDVSEPIRELFIKRKSIK